MPRLHLVFSLILILSLLLTPSGTQAFDEHTGRGILLVANKGDRSVSIVDAESGRQVATVAEGGTTGHELAASPNGGIAYVPIYGNSGVGKPGSDGRNIVVIDIGARKVIGNVDFGHGVRPHCAVFGPKDGMLYVTTELDDSVSVIDPRAEDRGVNSNGTGRVAYACDRTRRTPRLHSQRRPGHCFCSRSGKAKNRESNSCCWTNPAYFAFGGRPQRFHFGSDEASARRN